MQTQLYDQGDMIKESHQLLERTSSLKVNEIRILLQLILSSRQNGREISKSLSIPDSKVYPALKSLEKAGFINSSGTRPSQYWIVDINQIVKIINKNHEVKVQAFHKDMNELSDLMLTLWEPSSSRKERISYIVKEGKLVSELYNIIKSSKNELELILSEDSIKLLDYNSLIKTLIHMLDRDIVVKLAVPIHLKYELEERGLPVKQKNSTTYVLDPSSKLKIKQFISLNKLFIKQSHMTNTAYIIKDAELVAHVFHHPVKSFAIISSESDFLNMIGTCWDSNSECVSN